MADERSVHETRFEAAVKVIQSLPKNGTCPGAPTEEIYGGLRPQLMNLISFNLSSATVAYLTYFYSVFKRNVTKGRHRIWFNSLLIFQA